MEASPTLSSVPSQAIEFDYRGEQIVGTLSGSSRWWTFTSSSPAFTRHFSWGWLRSSQYLINPPTPDMEAIMELVGGRAEEWENEQVG
jgi:hypothetical protein